MNPLINVEEIDFEKNQGLVPTIIQEQNGTVLSLVYSTKYSLEKTIQTNIVWTYSRSRQGVFQKGATSGNIQKVQTILTDCDKDSLLFVVKQKRNACHKGNYSCFGIKKKFDFEELYQKILESGNSKKELNQSESYTSKLFNDEALLKRKLVEEAAEVITAKNKEELVWECADLLYFLFVIMAKEKITLEEIEKENQRRNNEKRVNKND